MRNSPAPKKIKPAKIKAVKNKRVPGASFFAVLKKTIRYFKPHKGKIAVAIIAASLSSAALLAAPYFVGKAIGSLSEGGGGMKALLSYAALLAGIYAVGAVAGFILQRVSGAITYAAAAAMRRDGYDKINRLPLAFLDSHASGNLISILTNDVDAIAEGLFQGITQILTGAVAIAGCMVMMIVLDGPIAAAVIIIAPLAVFVAAFIARKSGKLFKAQAETQGEYYANINENFANHKLISAYGYGERAAEKAADINKRLYESGWRANFLSAVINPSTRFVSNLSYVLIGLIGGLSGVLRGLPIDAISSLLIYSQQFSKPLNELTSVSSQLQLAAAAARRFFTFLEEAEERNESRLPDIVFYGGAVEFKNVTFGYAPGRPLFKDFSLKVEAGNMAAIAGPTGAGKSTLVNLLMRFYEPEAGAIYIDGQDISMHNRESVRALFAMVLQETWLKSGTIADNIAFSTGREITALGTKRLLKAAENANALPIIEKLPEGLNTFLSGAESYLSSGEKQLLTIARAFAGPAPMLILDEATSNVDSRTELNIRRALAALSAGRTSFIIAHRLSTIEKADIIIVMQDGAISETGTYRELTEREGSFLAEAARSGGG